jgi:Zn-dependent protease with chaperone function
MSSNFFAQQDLARRNTRLLVVLFSLAVLLLISLTNVIALFSLGFIDTTTLTEPGYSQSPPWSTIAWISVIVIGAVSIAILLKWYKLRHGGKAVAESLGGVRLSPDSTEPLQRRLLNVVEEMALAANLPVPPVYLLPEAGINAFAAGYSPADAVIGITQGALEQLNRDELQGVVGHEFSHVLNGDMRMNIRLIAMLNGILFIGHVGYFLMRSGSHRSASRSRNNKNNGGGILVLALGFIVIGYLGSFLGNLIKAAVSRQREYLADASAVQFSRNPRGIAGALKVIGGHSSHSLIRSANADENSHLFFGEAVSSWHSIFATHPPLAKRIKRLEPHWNGKFPNPRSKAEQVAEARGQLNADNTTAPPASNRDQLISALPLLLLHSSRQSQPASALVCCLLLQPDLTIRSGQLNLIKQIGSAVLLQQVDQLCDHVEKLNLLQQVQLLQRVIPALKTLSSNQFAELNQLLKALQQQLPHPNLGSWLTYQFIQHTVAVEFDQKQIVRQLTKTSFNELQPAILMLLALISSVAGDEQAQQDAWQQALLTLALATDTSEMPAKPSKPSIDWSKLTAALPQLLALAPKDKQRLWQAIQAAVNADNQLAIQEQALLLALALLLEMPYDSKQT